MYAIVALIRHLVDALIPPPGGPQRDIDARFADLVKDFNVT